MNPRRFLVQVAVLRPESDVDDLTARIASLDHGQVRERDDIVNVWLHIDAADRDEAVTRVRAQLEDRLDPAERQLVLAVSALGLA
jgi:hypothetical protein